MIDVGVLAHGSSQSHKLGSLGKKFRYLDTFSGHPGIGTHF